MSESWVEKYRPKKFSEVKGQEGAIKKIKEFIEDFNLGKLTKIEKKALLLHGPPGTGKTTLAHVLANETGSELFELNASDFRNRQKLQEILKPALEQKSLMSRNKIILIDEVDGISGADWGGVTELVYLISNSNYPIILTANDAWKRSLAPLRQKAELVQLREIDYRTIREILFDILRKEDLPINQEVITKIAIKAKGDVRAAINDLQAISKLKGEIPTEFDERNKEIDIFNALRRIFKEKPSQELLKLFDSVDMSLDEILLWIEQNIPKEYQEHELAHAYEMLSKADIFRGRIYKQQYWRFMLYESIFMSYGISASKKTPKPGFTSYQKPKKYAKTVHIGQKRALKEFPIIKQIILSNPKIAEKLKLEKEEIEYLKGTSWEK